MGPNGNHIGQHLRALREDSGHYQQDVAAKIRNISSGHYTNQGTICKWELGYQPMTKAQIDLYLRALAEMDRDKRAN